MAWRVIESDGSWAGENHKAAYMLDNAGDIGTPPPENSQLLPGSIAYTADLKNIWQKDNNGQWIKVGE